MDAVSQIQSLKLQLDNMKIQIENIKTLFCNNSNLMGRNQNLEAQVGNELLSLSINIFKAGIQTFNVGSILTFTYDYKNLLIDISQQINELIEKPDMVLQRVKQELFQIQKDGVKMMQQQMMAQQMQQQMMAQQMQQQMVAQQMMQQKIVLNQKPKINVLFRDIYGKKTNIVTEIDISIEELYFKYIEKAPLYGNGLKNIVFIVNQNHLEKNDKTKIKDFFKLSPDSHLTPTILVNFI